MLNQLFGHLVSCRSASRLLSQQQERALTPAERLRLKWHLAVCTACMRFEKQMNLMREAMRRYRQ